MIQKSTGYKSSDNQFHPTLEDAQKHEIGLLLTNSDVATGQELHNEIVDYLFSVRDKLVDILTTKPNSIPKARAVNGGRKPRKPKHIAEQFPLPIGDTTP